ncbi:MAG: DUF177 domain-containing protein [Xanthobacteraceae bacterium]|nr:DUF177 domain-containing protein [Xanthobacteraceae bacterium]
MTEKHRTLEELPWSMPVAVAQIPETGAHIEFEADAAQRDGLARLAGLRDVIEASAAFDLTHVAGGGIHAVGQVRALVGQSCVVTLEPVDNGIEEPINVIFMPQSRIASASRPPDGDDEEIPDPPEPIIGGTIDLGKLAMDMLFLGIDPYPRKPGAVFVPPAVEKDPDEHPFAVLKALKDGSPPGKKS